MILFILSCNIVCAYARNRNYHYIILADRENFGRFATCLPPSLHYRSADDKIYPPRGSVSKIGAKTKNGGLF